MNDRNVFYNSVVRNITNIFALNWKKEDFTNNIFGDFLSGSKMLYEEITDQHAAIKKFKTDQEVYNMQPGT